MNKNVIVVPEKVNAFRSPSEERQVTGRYVALGTAISLITLGLYHAWEHQIAVLAGLIVPALIMFLYILWVLYSANKDARRIRRLQVIRAQANLIEVITRPTTNQHKNISPASSKLSISSKCSHNYVNKPPSRSSSKSSLISQKVNNSTIKPSRSNKNLNQIVYYPDKAVPLTLPRSSPRQRVEEYIDKHTLTLEHDTPMGVKIQEIPKFGTKQESRISYFHKQSGSQLEIPKYGGKRKKQPVQVHSSTSSLGRTYSIA